MRYIINNLLQKLNAVRKKMKLKHKAQKPISKIETYLKYGFVVVEHEYHFCPRCGKTLNAGPEYQPKYCDQCGQRVSFAGIKWKKDRDLRCLPISRKEICL